MGRAGRKRRGHRRQPVLILLLVLAVGAAVYILHDRAEPATESPAYIAPVHIIGAEPVKRYPVNLSADLQDYIVDLCAEYEIDPCLVLAIIEVESGGNCLAVSPDGQDFGLMQIHVDAHKDRMERLGVIDILDATGNIEVGVDYLAELYGYGKPTEWVLMAYNGGMSYAGEMYARGQTSAYAEMVLRLAEFYEESAKTY